MENALLSRKGIIDALINDFEPLDFILAFWEAGAAAFYRIDEWSDLDLYVAVRDDAVEESIEITQKALKAISPIRLFSRLPEPTWHGHSQCFYSLKNASPYHLIDMVFMKESSKDKFLQFQIHGRPITYFDKKGIVKDEGLDLHSFVVKIKRRFETLKVNFEMYQVFVSKELNRKNDIEALSYYFSCTFRPLLEVLRMKYCPIHYDFFSRYVYHELPEGVVGRLHALYFISGRKNLMEAREDAERWFWEICGQLDFCEIERKIKNDSPSTDRK